MKKFFCFAGVIFSLILALSAVALADRYFYFSDSNPEFIDKGHNYITEEIPLIMERWEKDQFLSRASKEIVDPNNNKSLEEVDVLWNFFSEKLGKLSKIRDTKLLHYKNGMTERGREITAQYQIFAKFDKGEAEISVHLKKMSERWVITYFFVSSPALLPSEKA